MVGTGGRARPPELAPRPATGASARRDGRSRQRHQGRGGARATASGRVRPGAGPRDPRHDRADPARRASGPGGCRRAGRRRAGGCAAISGSGSTTASGRCQVHGSGETDTALGSLGRGSGRTRARRSLRRGTPAGKAGRGPCCPDHHRRPPVPEPQRGHVVRVRRPRASRRAADPARQGGVTPGDRACLRRGIRGDLEADAPDRRRAGGGEHRGGRRAGGWQPAPGHRAAPRSRDPGAPLGRAVRPQPGRRVRGAERHRATHRRRGRCER